MCITAKLIVEWQRWVKLGHSAMSAPMSALPRIVLQKSAMSASQARRGNIRISAVDFLNQCCALGDDLESKLLARAHKIVLQQYPPESGRRADIPDRQVRANRRHSDNHSINLIRARDNCRRHSDAELLGALDVDGQFECGRLVLPSLLSSPSLGATDLKGPALSASRSDDQTGDLGS